MRSLVLINRQSHTNLFISPSCLILIDAYFYRHRRTIRVSAMDLARICCCWLTNDLWYKPTLSPVQTLIFRHEKPLFHRVPEVLLPTTPLSPSTAAFTASIAAISRSGFSVAREAYPSVLIRRIIASLSPPTAAFTASIAAISRSGFSVVREANSSVTRQSGCE